MTDETQPPAGDETRFGKVQCHCSDPDDGIPDVGVSLGLGAGKVLWVGELPNSDGATCGVVFHDGAERIVAPFPDGTEWSAVADILRHHVGPTLAEPPPIPKLSILLEMAAADDYAKAREADWNAVLDGSATRRQRIDAVAYAASCAGWPTPGGAIERAFK